MPSGLDIERGQNINGSMAAYAEQLLISTGRNDWTSKIEDEDEAVLVKQLRSFLMRGGKYSDVRGSISLDVSQANRVAAVPQCYDHEFIVRADKDEKRQR